MSELVEKITRLLHSGGGDCDYASASSLFQQRLSPLFAEANIYDYFAVLCPSGDSPILVQSCNFTVDVEKYAALARALSNVDAGSGVFECMGVGRVAVCSSNSLDWVYFGADSSVETLTNIAGGLWYHFFEYA